MLRKCRNKPFYIWDKAAHRDKDRTWRGDCCFTDIIGRPRKNGGNRKPFFDYQKMLYLALFKPGNFNSSVSNNVPYPFKEKHLLVLKATGLGVSEFFLRLMAWLCVRNDDCRDSQMVIVTGPNIDLAIKLIKRMKKLFQDKLDVTFDNKETVLELNGCSIEAYPSNHIDSFRSLTNPKFLFLDELDFMPKFQQEEVRAVAERYIVKSDPFIVMVSTPNAPG
jgi:late competence protein required for DNA uptake (superfamily II DNA/RNA helicase)